MIEGIWEQRGLSRCWILLTLSGCSAQELEARDFVSVLTCPGW